MATRPPHNPNEHEGGGYEKRDAKIGSLLQFGFWLAVLVAITLFGMHWTFDYFVRTEPLGPPASPLVSPSQRVLPPSPRLQVQPHERPFESQSVPVPPSKTSILPVEIRPIPIEK